jgi:hypothetical protein
MERRAMRIVNTRVWSEGFEKKNTAKWNPEVGTSHIKSACGKYV